MHLQNFQKIFVWSFAGNPSWRRSLTWRCDLSFYFLALSFYLLIVCFTEGTKNQKSWYSLVAALSTNFFSGKQSCEKLRPLVNVFLFSLFQVNWKKKFNFFVIPNVRSAYAAIVSLVVEKTWIPSLLPSFSKSPVKSVPLPSQKVFCQFSIVLLILNARTGSFNLLFTFFCINVTIKRDLAN